MSRGFLTSNPAAPVEQPRFALDQAVVVHLRRKEFNALMMPVVLLVLAVIVAVGPLGSAPL